MKKVLWFKAKEYGWGWYPITWQGWTMVIIFIAGAVINTFRYTAIETLSTEQTVQLGLETLALLGTLVFITVLTGEKPGWRWGDKNNVAEKTDK